MAAFKVYGISANGRLPIRDHPLRAGGWGGLEIVTVKGVTVFAGYLADSSLRDALLQVPGVTVFDSHLSSRPMAAAHRTILAAKFTAPASRGAKAAAPSAAEVAAVAALAALDASATVWDAVTHLIDALGIPPGSIFDPNA